MDTAAETNRMCLELASALCARLCHDLSSPLGTLSGTLDLVADEPDNAAAALSVAGETAVTMVARLKLLRAAWAGDCGPLNRGRIADLAAGLPPRVRVSLDGLQSEPFNGPVARVLLNLLLLGGDALPMGGTVMLAGDAQGGIVVTLEGQSVRWDAGLAAALLDPALLPPSEPRTVQMPLTIRLAQAAGMRLSFLMAATPGPRSGPRLLLAPA